MAADATAGPFRPAARSAAGILGVAGACLTLTMFAACGVLLLLTRDYQRAVYGAGGTAAALVCLMVGFVVARRQPASPIGWLLLGWALLTPVVGVALFYSVLDYRIHHGTLPLGPVAVLLETAEFGIAVLAALTVLLFPDGRSQPRRWRWVLWVFLAASAALPAAIGVGIVKYRLYDIDRIISRTLAYAIVTGLLVGVYLGLVLLASLVLRSSSALVVAGSTLVVAALFHPLRRRVQRAVDRRFNRARYNADQVLDAFAARLQDAVELGTVCDELTQAVHAALEPAYLSIWVKEP